MQVLHKLRQITIVLFLLCGHVPGDRGATEVRCYYFISIRVKFNLSLNEE